MVYVSIKCKMLSSVVNIIYERIESVHRFATGHIVKKWQFLYFALFVNKYDSIFV